MAAGVMLVVLCGASESSAQSYYYYSDAYWNQLNRMYQYYDYYWYYDYYYYPWYYYDPYMGISNNTGNTGTVTGPNSSALTTTAQASSGTLLQAGCATKCTNATNIAFGGFTPAHAPGSAKSSSSQQSNMVQPDLYGSSNSSWWGGTNIVGADISWVDGLDVLYGTGRGRAAPTGGELVQKQTASGVISFKPGAEVAPRTVEPSYTYSRFADPRRPLPEPKAAESDSAANDESQPADQDATKQAATTGQSSGKVVRSSAVKTVQASNVRTVQPTVRAANVRTVQPTVAASGDFRSARGRRR